jgi:hypothetical protein
MRVFRNHNDHTPTRPLAILSFIQRPLHQPEDAISRGLTWQTGTLRADKLIGLAVHNGKSAHFRRSSSAFVESRNDDRPSPVGPISITLHAMCFWSFPLQQLPPSGLLCLRYADCLNNISNRPDRIRESRRDSRRLVWPEGLVDTTDFSHVSDSCDYTLCRTRNRCYVHIQANLTSVPPSPSLDSAKLLVT